LDVQVEQGQFVASHSGFCWYDYRIIDDYWHAIT
jgi:hypothetical protein